MKNKTIYTYWLIIIILFVFSWSLSIYLNSKKSNSLVKNRNISIVDLYGVLPKDIKMKIQDKETIVINVWATWCQPCRKEMPFLDKLSLKHDNYAFISVTDQTKEEAAPYIKNSPIFKSFLHVYDGQELINFIANYSNQKRINKGNSLLDLPTNVIFYKDSCVFIESGFSISNIEQMDSLLTFYSTLK